MLIGAGLVLMGILLHHGRRSEARMVALVNSFLLLLGWVVVTPIQDARGELTLGTAVHGFMTSLIFIGLVKMPRFSFYIIFLGGSLSFAVAAVLEFALPGAPTLLHALTM